MLISEFCLLIDFVSFSLKKNGMLVELKLLESDNFSLMCSGIEIQVWFGFKISLGSEKMAQPLKSMPCEHGDLAPRLTTTVKARHGRQVWSTGEAKSGRPRARQSKGMGELQVQ